MEHTHSDAIRTASFDRILTTYVTVRTEPALHAALRAHRTENNNGCALRTAAVRDTCLNTPLPLAGRKGGGLSGNLRGTYYPPDAHQ